MANDASNQSRSLREIATAQMVELRGRAVEGFEISWGSDAGPALSIDRKADPDLFNDILLACRTALSRRR